jgi:hypothetical protein
MLSFSTRSPPLRLAALSTRMSDGQGHQLSYWGKQRKPHSKKTAEGRPLTAVPSKLLSTPLSRRLISTCAPSNFLSLVPCPCIEMSQGVRQRLGGGVCLQAVPQWVGKVVMREVGIFPGNWAVFVPLRKHPMPACTHRALREVAYPSFSQVLTVVAYIQSSPPLAKHAVQLSQRVTAGESQC